MKKYEFLYRVKLPDGEWGDGGTYSLKTFWIDRAAATRILKRSPAGSTLVAFRLEETGSAVAFLNEEKQVVKIGQE